VTVAAPPVVVEAALRSFIAVELAVSGKSSFMSWKTYAWSYSDPLGLNSLVDLTIVDL